MEKESGSWRHLSQADGQLHNTRSTKFPLINVGIRGNGIFYLPPCAGKVSIANELPALGTFEIPSSKTALHCMPRTARGLSFMPDEILSENLVTGMNCMGNISAASYSKCEFPSVSSGLAANRFLVFDQTGDKTTLFYSSRIDTPVCCLNSSIHKPTNRCTSNVNDVGIKEDAQYDSDPVLTTVDSKSSDGSGMHEDSDDIDALLYSEDGEDYSDNDEVTSTGHSPGTLTLYKEEEWLEDGMEEVASSLVPSKRMKISQESHAIPASSRRACSAKGLKSSCYVDDAKSSNARGDFTKSGDTTRSIGNKRERKERISETVDILRSIIPGGRENDPVLVLEKAIHYLRSLKREAKSLGLANL